MATSNSDQGVNQHYGRGNLGVAILAALQAAGKNPEALSTGDLAPLDQFHIGGRQTTLELIRLADIQSGMKVLDVGGGIGGAARTLASEQACQVAVLDLTEEFCRVGEMLTARTGLSDRVTFQHGNALNMPFADASFDIVWTQHSSMNIADKERLYREIYRVLRPGGRFVLHDIMAGSMQPIHFPVPWARNPDISFLRPPQEIRSLLSNAGFKEVHWVDATATSMAWFQERIAPQENAASTAAPPGVHLLLGADTSKMFRNMARNMEEQRIAVVLAVFERAS